MPRPTHLALTAALLLTHGLAAAQAWPTRPIRVVVGFPAGSTTDVVARLSAQGLQNNLKQTVVVENRPGAASMIAATNVAQSQADGYSFLFGTLPTLGTGTLNEKLPIDPVNDFTPVGLVVSAHFLLVAAGDVPAGNLADFIRVLKADPAKYSFGSSGTGSTIHLAAEMFNRGIGVSVLHVPYKGTSEVVQDLLGRKISYGLVGLENMQHVKAGNLKAFAVTGIRRDPAAPDVPTLGESALPGFTAATTMLLLGPKNLARPIVDAVSQASNRANASDEVTQKLRAMGGLIPYTDSTPEATGKFLRDELTRWDALLKALKPKS